MWAGIRHSARLAGWRDPAKPASPRPEDPDHECGRQPTTISPGEAQGPYVAKEPNPGLPRA